MIEAFPAGLTLRQRLLKRSLDVVVSLGLVVLGSPFLVAGWVAARVSTGASGVFRQVRIGRYGAPFEVMKLRTMRTGSALSTTVTASNDVRITRVGAWLRKLKIDELPQLVNVLRGEMSLVGPRPDVPGFADRLTGEDRIILTVRPGITGPATLAFRHEEEMLAAAADPEAYNRDVIWPQKVELNKRYVETWTLLGDLRYVLATAGALPAKHEEVRT